MEREENRIREEFIAYEKSRTKVLYRRGRSMQLNPSIREESKEEESSFRTDTEHDFSGQEERADFNQLAYSSLEVQDIEDDNEEFMPQPSRVESVKSPMSVTDSVDPHVNMFAPVASAQSLKETEITPQENFNRHALNEKMMDDIMRFVVKKNTPRPIPESGKRKRTPYSNILLNSKRHDTFDKSVTSMD